MSRFLPELMNAWGDRLLHEGWIRVLLAVVAAFVVTRLRPIGPRWAWALGAVGLGVGLAARQASVVDDAFISFRYARNLVEGNGLVFNVGERVEGFTNLLWTLLLAAGNVVTGVELPLIALVGNLLVLTATLLVAATATKGRFPLAAWILAGSAVFRSHGTTGLETGLVSLLGLLALRDLETRPGRAGLWLVLSTLTRPDQALFFGVGALVTRLNWRYLGWAGLLVIVTAARWLYYGELAPNTAWAKSAELSYWSQGFVYAAEFWLGSYGWALLVPLAVWLRRGLGVRQVYVVLVVVLHTIYVIKLGGDFMAGRFWVALLAPLAWAAEEAVNGAGPWARAALVGLLVGTANGASLIPAGAVRWYVADEGTVYPVKSWFPVEIDHASWRIGHFVGETLADRGITPWMTTGTIGMVGYYGRLPLIDLHGLTDATVARMPLGRRGHIGHEKFASEAYLRERGVVLAQSETLCGRSRFPGLTTLRTPVSDDRKPWCLLRWEPALMEQLPPEWGYTPLERWRARHPDLSEEDRAWLDTFLGVRH